MVHAPARCRRIWRRSVNVVVVLEVLPVAELGTETGPRFSVHPQMVLTNGTCYTCKLGTAASAQRSMPLRHGVRTNGRNSDDTEQVLGSRESRLRDHFGQ